MINHMTSSKDVKEEYAGGHIFLIYSNVHMHIFPMRTFHKIV